MIEFSKKIEGEISKLRSARPALEKQIPQVVLDTYLRLLKGKHGIPPVCSAENGICSGCHLKLTPQTLNDIARYRVAVCDNCQYYVYLPEEQK